MAEGGIGSETPRLPTKQRVLGFLRRRIGFGTHPNIPTESLSSGSSTTDSTNSASELQSSSPGEIIQASALYTRENTEDQGNPVFEDNDNPTQSEDRILRVNGAEVHVTQKGRVIRLAEGDEKPNFLIDVTDRVEPNQLARDPNTTTTVREMYDDFDELEDVQGSNNGIVVTITDKFSPTPQDPNVDPEKRIYITHLGTIKWDEAAEKGSFPDIAILEKFDFTDRGMGLYVPWSFNSSRADEFFAKEIGEAFNEQKIVDNPPALENPAVIDAKYSVK